MRASLLFLFLSTHFAYAYYYLPLAEIRNIKCDAHERLSPSILNDICANILAGNAYYQRSKFPKAHFYYYQSKETLEAEKATDSPFYGLCLDKLAHIHYKINDFQTAKKYLLKWEKQSLKLQIMQYSLFNTLGSIYELENDFLKAEQYYDKALRYAYFRNHNLWIGIISTNLGKIYYHRGDFKHAKSLFQQELKYYNKTNAQYSTVSQSLCFLASMALKEDSLALAHEYLQQADSAFQFSKNDSSPFYHKVKSEYFMAIKQLDSAVIHMDLKDKKENEAQAKKENEMGVILQSIESLKSISLSRANQKYTSEKAQITWLSFLALLAMLSFLAWMTFFFIKFQKRRKKEKQAFEEFRETSEQLIQSYTNKLEQTLESLKEKNTTIEQLNQIEKGYSNTSEKTDDQSSRDCVDNQLNQFKILTKDHWNEFTALFNSIHPKYMSNLMAQFPSLTDAEIRQCCLIRLNLSNAEMAAILGVSDVAIRQTNLRLRKRFGIDNQSNLIDFLFGITT